MDPVVKANIREMEKVDALHRDAARYRWLRKRTERQFMRDAMGVVRSWALVITIQADDEQELDAAIDAAMEKSDA